MKDDRPLSILMVMRAPVGGLFRHVCDLTEDLAIAGQRVGVVADSSTGGAGAEARFAALAERCALGVRRVPMGRMPGVGDVATINGLRGVLSELRPDIVHGHGAKGGAYARIATRTLPPRGSRPATVYTPHGGSLHYSWQSPAGMLFLSLERGLLPITDALVFESSYARMAFAGKVADPGRRAHVIPNGLAAHEFDEVDRSAARYDFLFVGELRDLKGVDVLLDALARLGDEYRRPNLLVVGAGPDEAKFRARAAAPDLAGRVDFAGARPARSMFGEARAIVVPSRAESLPYIVLEAAAAGLPVIATSVGGIPEIFGPTADALVEPGNVDALATAMRHLLDDPRSADFEAAERRDHVREVYTRTRMSGAILDLYRQLAATGHPAQGTAAA